MSVGGSGPPARFFLALLRLDFMAAETLACPYCNSSVTLLRAPGTGQRVRCPRCHELIPYRAGEGDIQQPAFAVPVDPSASEDALGGGSQPLAPRSWSTDLWRLSSSASW